ncbi:MAG: molybdopterin-synthase adenylyltransferase MoeB [Saprospiraceae bacterium]|mgnify:CR=1 FL=1|nr:molybdopterin-synthase adenylyltransferase MoeB [Saprospiraceae bacterium]
MRQAIEEIKFSKEELERYSRHLIIPEFNIEGQKKLKHARVLVVGTGGLGAPLLLYLTAAGVGTIGIVDFDIVDKSNLQRQVLFTTQDVGRPKVEAARERLNALNPHVHFEVFNTRLESSNALEIISQFDIVADGTDNFPTRYLVNDACVLAGKTNVFASIFRFEGQASVFNYQFPDGSRGPNYRDLFPVPPPPGLVPSCAEGGVIGVLPGILGSLQANEVIKVISGVGEPLAGRFFQFDAAEFKTRIFKISKDPDNPLTGNNPTQTELIDYEYFCGINLTHVTMETIESNGQLSVSALNDWIKSGKDFQLIDVREPYEYDIANLGGILIPKGEILKHLDEINREKDVVIHCRSGKRSQDVIDVLKQELGLKNLHNLKGGILAWADEIDTTMAKY